MRFTRAKKIKIGLGLVLFTCIGGVLFLTPRRGGMWSSDLPNRKVRVDISSTKKFFFVGEPIPITVTITNLEKKDVDHFGDWDSGFYPYTFKAIQSSGKDLPFTRYGKQNDDLKTKENLQFPVSRPIDQTISPGSSKSEKFFLNRYIDFSLFDDGNREIKDIYVQVKRYGVISEHYHIKLIDRMFDLENPEIMKTVKTGVYGGEKIKDYKAEE